MIWRFVACWFLISASITTFISFATYDEGLLIHDGEHSHVVYGWNAVQEVAPFIFGMFVGIGILASLIALIIKGGMK